jgi:hypothetical protein
MAYALSTLRIENRPENFLVVHTRAEFLRRILRRFKRRKQFSNQLTVCVLSVRTNDCSRIESILPELKQSPNQKVGFRIESSTNPAHCLSISRPHWDSFQGLKTRERPIHQTADIPIRYIGHLVLDRYPIRYNFHFFKLWYYWLHCMVAGELAIIFLN